MQVTPSTGRNEWGGLGERFNFSTPSSRYEYVDVHFPAAGVDVEVRHTLAPPFPQAVLYQVVQTSTVATVYHDGSPLRRGWTSDTIFLRSNVANTTARLLLTLSAEGEDVGIEQRGDPGPTTVAAGVAFPATQVPSTDVNVLDDYEEGTFTPSVLFGGGSTGLTYSSRTGRYTKIGDTVTADIALQLSAKGSSTGSATISGLPFTAGGRAAGSAVKASMAVGITGAVLPWVEAGTSAVILYASTAASDTPLSDADFTNTTLLIVSIRYKV